jgi:hypothetical protein
LSILLHCHGAAIGREAGMARIIDGAGGGRKMPACETGGHFSGESRKAWFPWSYRKQSKNEKTLTQRGEGAKKP